MDLIYGKQGKLYIESKKGSKMHVTYTRYKGMREGPVASVGLATKGGTQEVNPINSQMY